jgi:hypothetical protein
MKIMVDHRNSENELIQLENIRIVLGKHWDIIHTNRDCVFFQAIPQTLLCE